MINKRLIATVPESKKYIAGNVACQWISLMANIPMMVAFAKLLQSLFEGGLERRQIIRTLVISLFSLLIRYL